MSTTVLGELASRVRGEVRLDEPLARYTTYRIGGPAAALVLPEGTHDVVETLGFCRETETKWVALGLGSNVLVADSGFDGVVIRVGRGMDRVAAEADGKEVWTVGAGLPIPRLARRTARAGLSGVHRLIGVPGAVGGGVFMNAGAHGQDFSQVVRSLELVDPEGTVRTVPAADISWSYRSSNLVGIVTAATLALIPTDPERLTRDIRRHFKWRRVGTPFDEPCCGSVFRNPGRPAGSDVQVSTVDRDPRTAGQLVDAAGLKGFQIGGAQVSPKHANYIVNTGGAAARDVQAVIEAVREKVLQEFGVELQLEVKIID